MKAFIFECSSTTYLDCVEKNLFGSNKPWPLQIKAGDYCLLHHYEIGGLLGLWQATSDGSKNIVPRIWGGKFPPWEGEAPAEPKSIVRVHLSLFANNRSPGIPARPPVAHTKPRRAAVVAWASARVVHRLQAPPQANH